jgi:hypothetical protein
VEIHFLISSQPAVQTPAWRGSGQSGIGLVFLFNTSKMMAVATIPNEKIFLGDEILMRIQSAALVS